MMTAEPSASLSDSERRVMIAQAQFWLAIQAGQKARDPAFARPDIEGLFQNAAMARPGKAWPWLDQLQLEIAALLPDAVVPAELAARLGQAGRIGVAEVAEHRKAATLAASAGDQRMLLLVVLRDIIHRYGQQAEERRAREAAGRRMVMAGGLVLGGAIVATMIAFFFGVSLGLWPKDQPMSMHAIITKFHLVAVVTLGVIGALFFRLLAFSSHSGAVTWQDIDRDYRASILVVRLTIGGVAAYVFYHLIASGILGGNLFPVMQTGTVTGFGDLWIPVTVGGQGGQGGQTYTMPSPNFAKLVIWSFLAGYAERLLPDQLAGLERQAATAQAANR